MPGTDILAAIGIGSKTVARTSRQAEQGPVVLNISQCRHCSPLLRSRQDPFRIPASRWIVCLFLYKFYRRTGDIEVPVCSSIVYKGFDSIAAGDTVYLRCPFA